MGDHGKGNGLDQLNKPKGIDIDDDGSLYIADQDNHRIVRWISDAKNGEVVAGGNDRGDNIDQLYWPIDVVIDKKNNSIIICDAGNNRVVKWSLTYPQNPQILVPKIVCDSLALDNNGELYVSEWITNKIIRWKQGAKEGVVAVGENAEGDDFNELFSPGNLVVDHDYSIYVSDRRKHRVMKWLKGAKQGIVVAGGHGMGDSFNQLVYPKGLIVDHLSNVYVADPTNYRVMRWPNGSKVGSIIVELHSCSEISDGSCLIDDIALDRQGNLYIVNTYNHSVQKFHIDD